MTPSKTLHETQRLADKKHHESRVSWLSSSPCCWSDGTMIGEHLRMEMLTKSSECLRLINEFGMSTNHANIEDY